MAAQIKLPANLGASRHPRSAKVFVPGSRGERLTAHGKLLLAQAVQPDGQGVSVKGLLSFADNVVERHIFDLQAANPSSAVLPFSDPLGALLWLRFRLVPFICQKILLHQKDMGPLGCGVMNAYSVAFERVLFERLYRAAHQQQFQWKGEEQLRRWANKTLGQSVDHWFDGAPESPLFWLRRFNEWRDWALKSLSRYFRKQSIDIRRESGVELEAAYLGILQLLDQLPEDQCLQWLREARADATTFEIYRRNVRKDRTTQAPQEILNHWLIECWPLVLEYGWNYRDLQQVANRKFVDSIDAIGDMLDTPRAIKERCTKLGLKLGRVGQDKVGRARAKAESLLPPLFRVALQFDSVAAEPKEWFYGQHQVGFIRL